jgi:hypothetical protein
LTARTGDVLFQLARDKVAAVQSQITEAFSPVGGDQFGRLSRRAESGPGAPAPFSWCLLV